MSEQLARRAKLDIIYQGTNISKNLEQSLIGFQATDNIAYNADEITVAIQDRQKKWLKSWWPDSGDKLSATIQTTDWKFSGQKTKLDIGTFLIDEPEYSLSPNTMQLRGVSTPRDSDFTDTEREKVWEKISLKSLAEKIAKDAGLKLIFDSDINPIFQRLDQSSVSDMNFLCDLCKKIGVAFKISVDSIIIFDFAKYEAKKPLFTIENGGWLLLEGGSLRKEQAYTACEVTCSNASGSTISYTFKDPNKQGRKQKILKQNEAVANLAEAELVAKGRLREVNQYEYVCSLSLVGDTKIMAGITVNLKGFGVFDGVHMIDKASYSLSPFTVNIETHKILGW